MWFRIDRLNSVVLRLYSSMPTVWLSLSRYIVIASSEQLYKLQFDDTPSHYETCNNYTSTRLEELVRSHAVLPLAPQRLLTIQCGLLSHQRQQWFQFAWTPSIFWIRPLCCHDMQSHPSTHQREPMTVDKWTNDYVLKPEITTRAQNNETRMHMYYYIFPDSTEQESQSQSWIQWAECQLARCTLRCYTLDAWCTWCHSWLSWHKQ